MALFRIPTITMLSTSVAAMSTVTMIFLWTRTRLLIWATPWKTLQTTSLVAISLLRPHLALIQGVITSLALQPRARRAASVHIRSDLDERTAAPQAPGKRREPGPERGLPVIVLPAGLRLHLENPPTPKPQNRRLE
jgi:hypothetical protein